MNRSLAENLVLITYVTCEGAHASRSATSLRFSSSWSVFCLSIRSRMKFSILSDSIVLFISLTAFHLTSYLISVIYYTLNSQIVNNLFDLFSFPLLMAESSLMSGHPKRRCEITIISFSRSICRGGVAALIGVTGKPYPSCLSCHSHPIRPFRALSPRGKMLLS
ncbi:Uncharacterised protein [Bacteroides xylanisolvens]|nr:Uncharacterised protein [Bacteroides xylanisolvens]